MIYTEMNGRCGNQLFHYAVARYVSIKTGDPNLSFDFNKIFDMYDKENGFYDVLKDYRTVPYSYYKDNGKIFLTKSNIIQKIAILIKSLHIYSYKNKSRSIQAKKNSLMQKMLNKVGVYWLREGVNKIYPSQHKTSLISGPCEVNFIYEIQDILQQEIQPKQPILDKNMSLMSEIENSDSVCVSVRRGDFFSSKNAKSFAVCSPRYYRSAKKIIDGKKMNNLKFFVFSDDIDWCKRELNLSGNNVRFVSQEMPVYETLRLMYSCKHFILSNSTFSWWGQFLSRNKNKIVISPERWNNDGYSSKLIGKNWIKVKV